MLAAIAALLLAVAVTPVPKVTGPIPVTADSYPFMASSKSTPALDLSTVGYIEEEYLVAGTANVYDWAADGTVSVKTANAPYTTRILVRRPATRFSGTVIVELPLSSARRFDWPMTWGLSHGNIIDRGDAWVGISMPGASEGLKKFNPTRYANVSFANPAPGAPCSGAQNDAAPAIEDGVRWDVISQVGALLKGDTMRAQNLFLTGADVATYANAIHANLASGKPVFDGYVLRSPFTMARINPCSPALAANDPRQVIKNVGAPVIEVAAQGEIIGGTYASRRADSDEPNDRFRLYEVASAAHLDKAAYFGFPQPADQVAAVGRAQGTPDWPFNTKCDPDIPLMDPSLIGYAFNAALANLDEWARKGTPAPRAPRVELKDAGTPQASIVTDKLGHGLGGVRTPQIDVPDANYFTGSPGPGTCRETGRKEPFDAAKVIELYGDRKGYASKFTEAVDRLVKERWLTPGDAKRLKQAMSANSN